MQSSGYHWFYALLISMIIYTGAFQFILISFLISSTPFITVVLTALFMNSRQIFYSLGFVDDFKKMGK